MFVMKFMDGTPVPDDYQKTISNFVHAAAIADIREEDEIEMAKSRQEEGKSHE